MTSNESSTEHSYKKIKIQKLELFAKNYGKATLKDIDFEFLVQKEELFNVNMSNADRLMVKKIIEKDAKFFRSNNLMDYSLLIAIEMVK